MRTVRNIVIGFITLVSIAAIIRTVVTLLSPEQREKLNARIHDAVEAGKQAAEERRHKLEHRLDELVGENNLN